MHSSKMENSKGRENNMEEGLFTCYPTEYALRAQDQAAVNRDTLPNLTKDYY